MSIFNLLKKPGVIKNILVCILGSSILSFGMYNVHALANVTEGGVLGMTLLLHHWFGISPSISGFIMNAICYIIGWRLLGKAFIACSAVCAVAFSASYAVCELFPPLWPALADMPFLAAILGAMFVGVGVGLCVRSGGAPSGDDALAMSIGKVTRLDIRWIYLSTDLAVLALSISYLDLKRLILSLVTVILSGQIIGIVQKIGIRK